MEKVTVDTVFLQGRKKEVELQTRERCWSSDNDSIRATGGELLLYV